MRGLLVMASIFIILLIVGWMGTSKTYKQYALFSVKDKTIEKEFSTFSQVENLKLK